MDRGVAMGDEPTSETVRDEIAEKLVSLEKQLLGTRAALYAELHEHFRSRLESGDRQPGA
ncbi:hypothetical protein [Rathayibacter toxicus]|uniref:Uncharacterized protein n=1 Tax=Rathayibacter toxicus TaxID=145458 RepID=A0A2S5Y6J6_9MICO|nr:hypothetical protein [Rathayibacter toxicus]PPG21494.1 hypothetical protein C5D15_04425 [Rathayibacter toxicus]PPG46458.1 hypothetical protein C5D16_04410 [Rathayibacter toxicus]PPH72488.1 hypothetical protein C5D24_04370 [Rathayibacter toxicus]PPI15065.1 hypothetical protein C5C51_04425 [Rathayibacter toxicus]PPI44963.1 hypothetical protein C5D43_04410 [Rathayibacter toxicus]